jgi:hypothetical protein
MWWRESIAGRGEGVQGYATQRRIKMIIGT